jgi:hypothetical protein
MTIQVFKLMVLIGTINCFAVNSFAQYNFETKYFKDSIDLYKSKNWDNYVFQIEIKDMNYDSLPDLILANCRKKTTIFYNTNELNFSNPAQFEYITPLAGGEVFDLNGDEKTEQIQTNKKSINYNSEDIFGPTNILKNKNEINNLKIADLNLDGLPDMVTPNRDKTISVYLNKGNFKFSDAFNCNLSIVGAYLAVGDLNGDLLPEIVVTTYYDNFILILTNLGNGTFKLEEKISLEMLCSGIAIGDMNGDKKNDIVVGRSASDNSKNYLAVLINKSQNEFKYSDIKQRNYIWSRYNSFFYVNLSDYYTLQNETGKIVQRGIFFKNGENNKIENLNTGKYLLKIGSIQLPIEIK